MRIGIIYESFFGNTQYIAEAMRNAIGDEHYCEMINVQNDVDINMEQFDFYIVGSPTRGFNATPEMKKFLNTLQNGSLNNKPAIAFDTRIDLETIKSKALRFMVHHGGYAAKPIAKILHKKGAQVIGKAGFFVLDEKGPLKEGEEIRAAEWVKRHM